MVSMVRPFLVMCSTSIMSSILPIEWRFSSRWAANFDFVQLFFEVPVMILEACPEGAARLSDIFHAKIGTCETVNPAVVKHVVSVVC